MIKYLLSTLALVLATAMPAAAQIVTTTPAILQESSQGVVLTYHADSPAGNGGMANLPSTTEVYAHIGVITDQSNGQWAYAPSKWCDNAAKYKLTYKSANTYELSLGDMRQYFGIANPNEHIKKIALVFRDATGNAQGKTKSGGDIFVDVAPEGFQLQFTSNASNTVIGKATSITFTAAVSQNADITIAVNGTTIASKSGVNTLSASYNFTSTGSYHVTATAKSNGETIEKYINVAYPGASSAGTYPGGVPKMGAVKNADGSVTFCLAAPGKSNVVLVPSWDDYDVLEKNIMKYQDYQGQRYFFTTVTGLKDNEWYPYYYIVDATYKVADPYARLVLDCYSDKWLDQTIWPDMPRYPYERFDDTMLAVYRGDLDGGYKFAKFNIPAKENLVIYEMLIRDFTGTEGAAEGNGTLRKAIEKIDYLSNLGVNAVELMPVMEFNGNNSWGYNTNFYFAPDKAYGSPKDLKDFVALCHSRGIAVILDIVFNQSDGLHPWYQMYTDGNRPMYNQTAPHDYSVLNDWKQEHPLVQQQWADAVKFWLKEYDVDGFRFDLVKGLGTAYPNGTEAYNYTRVETMKRIHAAMKEVKPDAIHINENLAAAQEENEMANDGQLNWSNISNNSCQFAMGYSPQSNLNGFFSSNYGRNNMSTVAYAESHDEERVGYKVAAYGASGVKGNNDVTCKRLGQLAAQMLLIPGPKMIWQFGELGADQTTKNGGSNNTDPKTVIWNNLNKSGNKELHAIYRAMCSLRRDNPDLFTGNPSLTLTGFSDNINTNRIIRVTNGNKEAMAFINCRTGGANQTVGAQATLLSKSNSRLVCASPGFTPTLNATGTSVSVSVPANSFAVYATTTTTGVDDVIVDQPSLDGPAEYYNLQGSRMDADNLTPGIYICRQGNTATKVVIK